MKRGNVRYLSSLLYKLNLQMVILTDSLEELTRTLRFRLLLDLKGQAAIEVLIPRGIMIATEVNSIGTRKKKIVTSMPMDSLPLRMQVDTERLRPETARILSLLQAAKAGDSQMPVILLDYQVIIVIIFVMLLFLHYITHMPEEARLELGDRMIHSRV